MWERVERLGKTEEVKEFGRIKEFLSDLEFKQMMTEI